ncbi:MAG: 2-hydroxyacyl-CoA dehydratase [Deltaproteobacteria bacterium]|nr:2-hydroxyacyl-CoA dehydratase [Deltaproteobacteria bacterium]
MTVPSAYTQDPGMQGASASRRDAIAKAQARGQTVLGVLPIVYPKPLLTAMDILAVELWGPPGAPRSHHVGRLQAYVCALARNALAFIAGGGADAVDGFLYPHTCDSIQGLATQIPDFGGSDKPAFRFRLPKGPARPSARAYLRREYRHLAENLSALTKRSLDADRLAWALDLHALIDRARATLLAGRDRLALNDRSLYTLLRRGEYLWPEAHLGELEGAVAMITPRAQAFPEPQDATERGIPLLVSGIVPAPMGIFDHLRDAGAYVGADDYAAIGRRVGHAAWDAATLRQAAVAVGTRDDAKASDSAHTGITSRSRDPFDVLVDRFFDLPPCPTRAATIETRLAHLDRLYAQGACQGVILHAVQFCEPELFDVPAIRRHVQARNIPFLLLDSELEAGLSGRAVTRLEAFVEMVSARPKDGGAA